MGPKDGDLENSVEDIILTEKFHHLSLTKKRRSRIRFTNQGFRVSTSVAA
jgi:hypothetical protein